MVSTEVLLAVLFLAPVVWPHGQRAAAQSLKVAATNTAARGRYTVVIKDMKYQPPILKVKVGSSVEWKNADIVAHTVEVYRHEDWNRRLHLHTSPEHESQVDRAVTSKAYAVFERN